MSMTQHGVNPRALASAMDANDEAVLLTKLRRMKDAGTLNLQTVSNVCSRANVRLIADKVSLLQKIGLPEAEAKSLGGDFQR